MYRFVPEWFDIFLKDPQYLQSMVVCFCFSFSICSIDNTSYYSCHQIYCWLPVMPMIKGKKVVRMIYPILHMPLVPEDYPIKN